LLQTWQPSLLQEHSARGVRGGRTRERSPSSKIQDAAQDECLSCEILFGVPCNFMLHRFVGPEMRTADILERAKSVGIFQEERDKKKLLSGTLKVKLALPE